MWESKYQSQSRAQCPETCRTQSLDPDSKDLVQPWPRQQHGSRRCIFLVLLRVTQRQGEKERQSSRQAEAAHLTLYLNPLLRSSTLWSQCTWCLWLPFPSGSKWGRLGCVSVRDAVCQLSLAQLSSTLPAGQSSCQEMLPLMKPGVSFRHKPQCSPGRFLRCLLLQCIRRRGITHTQGMRAKTDHAYGRRCSVFHHVPGRARGTRGWCGCFKRSAVD